MVNHNCDAKNVLYTLLHPTTLQVSLILVRGMGCGNYPLTIHYTVLLMLDPELVVCNGCNNRYEPSVTCCMYAWLNRMRNELAIILVCIKLYCCNTFQKTYFRPSRLTYVLATAWFCNASRFPLYAFQSFICTYPSYFF